jgi:tyrosine decarboxylase/aspartate 1-decarboxylase
MESKGRTRREVVAELRRILEKDGKYENGKILSSLCTSPQSIAKSAHQVFLCSNLGDPGLFPGSCWLEQDVIRKLADLLKGKNIVGFVVSGGTEANMLALWAARNNSSVDNPEVVVSESAHFSFNKVCNMLKLKPIQAKLDSSQRMIPESVEACITERTVAIVGTAGTAELGIVDPIGTLSEIALAHCVPLHVDAALGGLMIPFLEPNMQEAFTFDFRLEGVKSVTIDPHKMGMSTIPAGGILFRDRTNLENIKTETPYLTETPQYTFVGTRSGAPVAATWAVFELLGREGFRKIVKQCISLTKFLSKGIEVLGLSLVAEPTLNIVGFRSVNSKKTVETLRKHGWFVSYVPRLDCVRVVVMPHTRKQNLKAFLADLGKAPT